MRLLGGVLFLLGCAGAAYSTWAVFNRRRPADLLFAAAAPLAVVVALAGLVTLFVPGFFG